MTETLGDAFARLLDDIDGRAATAVTLASDRNICRNHESL